MGNTLARIIVTAALAVGSGISLGTSVYCDNRILSETSKIPGVNSVEKLSPVSQAQVQRLSDASDYAGLIGVLGIGATVISGVYAFGGILEDEKRKKKTALQG